MGFLERFSFFSHKDKELSETTEVTEQAAPATEVFGTAEFAVDDKPQNDVEAFNMSLHVPTTDSFGEPVHDKVVAEEDSNHAKHLQMESVDAPELMKNFAAAEEEAAAE